MKPEVTSVLSVICISVASCCVFPKYLQDNTWYKNIRGSSRTSIYFRDNIIEYQQEDTELNYITDEWEDTCIQMVDISKFIITHKNTSFSCIVFIKRSQSIVQLKVSKSTEEYSSFLCDEELLNYDQWLLVSFEKAQTEFTVCPFSGGYNMKIKDKAQTDHPCNFMDLPMRFESECHTGEGITFDFRTNNCIGEVPMNQVQKVLCVTSWRQDGDVLTVLRDPKTGNLWCLRIPARRTFDGKTVMILYIDLTCNGDIDTLHFTLELELVSQNSLCMDEHNGCHRLPCTDYFVSQCLRTCGKCDPNIYPTACDFPRKIRGEWQINDSLGSTVVNISGSRLQYKRVGTFNCLSFSDSPSSRKTKQFTTVSYFNNGCRPRYTCASFNRINSNVFGFALSQSKVWPLQKGHEGVWSEICNSNNFNGDPQPVGDTFRTYNSVFKPMIAKQTQVTEFSCPIRSSYLFNATFQTGGTCGGRLYKVCQRQSNIRIEFENCPFTEQKVQTFACIGSIDSKYWENVILLQNSLDFRNTSCLILSDIEPGRVLMLPSGECDRLTWTYVNVGLRKAALDLLITPEVRTCRNLDTTTVSLVHTKASTAQDVKPLHDAFISETYSDSQKAERNKSAKSTHKHRHHDKGHETTTPSFPYKVVQHDGADKVVSPAASSSSNTYSFIYCLDIIFTVLLLVR